ncbi:energy transducer TonB [Lysobacter sp. A6]|uniref:Energy transducer TonB n=1 Tax=Noviluteimonas lactosilytica TaxID=2888523 RepID=A0ABS8JKI9_9GAMM|nr:energy transducer TonB [Lysobacter lactosilyticus]MCC8364131.1 energy transducer TonB [Lysobacter lactosilyticus]
MASYANGIRGVVAAAIVCFSAGAGAERLPNYNIANEGGLAKDWTVAPGAKIVAPAYPAEYDTDERPDACIALRYTVYPDGTTGDFKVLRTWKSGPVSRTEMRPFWLKFARASAAAVGQWRFQPRDVASAKPVTTVATLSFFGATVADASELRAHCRITDLAVFMRDLDRRDTMVSKQIEHTYRARSHRMQMQALTPGPR